MRPALHWPVAAVACAAGGVALAADLPTPMNFRNVTSGRINQTVAENTGNNVKEVGYGDIDNDGDMDVVVGAAGGIFGLRQNKLYRNDGGVFNEISGAPVIPGFSVNDLTRHVFIKDYDDDGWNDILIANDDLAGGGPFKIYMNQHPGDVFSHFVEEGAARGLHHEASCGAISADVDGDGDFDVYSGNYPGPSQDTLYLNDGTANFTVVTSTHVPVDGDYTIDVAAGDLNGDGKLDLLVSNHSPNWIYYNDKLNAGDHGAGDYKYGPTGTDGKQNIGNSSDGAMEPGDFNNDGRLDYYQTNKVGVGDRIFVNLGNDANGMATFTEVQPPSYVSAGAGNKTTVADLNADGRLDILVPMVSGRPAVLRNTTVNGVTSFVDWSSGSFTGFPSGITHQGHHGELFDTNGDGDLDIFLGARNGDFLFEQVPAVTVQEIDVVQPITNFFNRDPLAIVGNGSLGQSDTYSITGLGSGFLALVLNGPDDYLLEILDGPTVIADSDRGGAGIEEAMQESTGGGDLDVRVTITGCGSGGADVNGDCAATVDDLVAVILAWGGTDGPEDVNKDGFIDVDDMVEVILQWGPVEKDYQLEMLSRSG